MKSEQWKDIKGYEGYYAVSNFGRVMSLGKWVLCPLHGKIFRKTRILKIRRVATGYDQVALYRDRTRKVFYTARLVAIAFIPNPQNKPEVNHKKPVKLINRASNLEWTTHTENIRHAYKNKLVPIFSGDDWHRVRMPRRRARA